MAGLHLEKGAVVEFHGRRYTCGGRGPGGGFQLYPHRGRSNHVLKPEAAFDALEKGQLIIVQEESDYDGDPIPSAHFDLSVLDESERDKVLMRHFYMKRLAHYRGEGGTLSDVALADFARRTHTDYVAECRKMERKRPSAPMSPAALRRWFKRWNESGFNSACLVRDAKGNSHSKLTRDQEDLLNQAIEQDYLDRTRVTARTAYTRMCARIRVENRIREARGETEIPTPSYNTLLSHLKKVDLFDKLKARYNAAHAQKVTRHYGITPPCRAHLERAQVDHTQLDVYVDFGRDILVRPWLTLVLDSYSKAILGFWITPEPPSAESVMQALKMAILPKDMRALGGDPDWPWPMHGIPGELTLDNGKEFLGRDLEMAACELGITLNFTPPRSPWNKAQVEREFGVTNRSLLAQLPGQVFKYEPETHGLEYPHLKLDELKRLFLQYVTTVRHRKVNQEGHSPERLWHESVSKHGNPGTGLDPEYVAICLSKTEGERTVHNNGIQVHSLIYNNEWLSRLRNEMAPEDDGQNKPKRKPKVKVKWSASDMGVIYVLNPFTHEYFAVEAKQEGVAGRSLYNHQVVLREQRARQKAGMSDDSYLDAELALHQAIQDLTALKKNKGKKKGARRARFEGGSPDTAQTNVTTSQVSIESINGDLVDTTTGEILGPSKPDQMEDEIIDFTDDLEFGHG